MTRHAILFVGQERSLERTFQSLEANLLAPNRPVLFFACETSDPTRFLARFKGYEVGGAILLPTFRTSEYGHLLEMALERPAASEAVFDRARRADGLNWTADYLRSSGTILQYYQLWKAWITLVEYEKTHGMTFDLCMKCRLDIQWSVPFFFDAIPREGSESVLRAMGNSHMKDHPRNPATINPYYEHPYGQPVSDNLVWSWGPEQVFLSRRSTFQVFGPMVLLFGLWDSTGPFAFNSESFFHQVCCQHSLVHWEFIEEKNPLFAYGPSDCMVTILR